MYVFAQVDFKDRVINLTSTKLNLISNNYQSLPGKYFYFDVIPEHNNIAINVLLNETKEDVNIASRDFKTTDVNQKAQSIIFKKGHNQCLIKLNQEANLIISANSFDKITDKNYDKDVSSSILIYKENPLFNYTFNWVKIYDNKVTYTLYNFPKDVQYSQSVELFIENTISKKLDKYKLDQVDDSESIIKAISNENIYDVKLVAKDNTTGKLYLYKNILLNNYHSIPLNTIFPISFINTFDKKFSTVEDLQANTDYIINFSYLNNNFNTSKVKITQDSSSFNQETVIDFNKSYVKFTTIEAGKYDISFNFLSNNEEMMNDFDIFIVKSKVDTNIITIPITKTVVYSVDSDVNSTFSFSTDKIFKYNRATINIKSSVKDISLDIKSINKSGTITTNVDVGLDVTPVIITTEDEQEDTFSFTIKVTSSIQTDTTLRLSITIDSLDILTTFTLDEKQTNSNDITYGYIEISNENKLKDGFIILSEEVDIKNSKIILTDSNSINKHSYIGTNQGTIIKDIGFTFNTGNNKFILFEIHSKPLKATNSIEVSLVKSNFEGHSEVEKVKFTTTKPKIFEITNKDLFNQYLYLYSAIDSEVKAILSVNEPVYTIDAMEVNSVISKNGIISPIELDLSKYLKQIDKLYISLFSINEKREHNIQLNFGSDAPIFFPINNSDSNFEIFEDIKANQVKIVIIKSDKDMPKDVEFGLSTKGDVLLAYRQVDNIDNIFSSDLINDMSAESTSHDITYSKGFIIVKLKGSNKDFKGKLYFTRYEKVSDSTKKEEFDQNRKYFYSFEPTSDSTVSINFNIKPQENSFKLYIDSRSGEGEFTYNGQKQLPIEDKKTTTLTYEKSTNDITF